MKTYSKLLSRTALMLATAFMFCSMSAKAKSNSVVLTDSYEAIVLTETISAPPANLQIVSLIPVTYNGNVQIRCHGTNTGTATVEATGGVLPYTYQWSNALFQNGSTAYGMTAGTHTVTVTDAVGNSVSQSLTLTQNPPLQGIANVTPILCHGGVATISMSATGGTPPYNGMSWSQYAAGNYSITVSDANGCRDQVLTTIVEPPILQATSTVTAPILCNGDVTSVLVEATGGVGLYNGVGIYNEFGGVSSYVITDGNGCYAYTEVFIDQPSVLEASVTATDIACRGGASDVVISGLGGMPPYTGTGSLSASAGNYSYSILDANGCQATTSISITQPAALIASISNTPIACNGDLSAVEVTAAGGNEPYSGPGTFFEQAGVHTYTVEDANGCWVDISTLVIEPGEIYLDVSWLPLQGNGSTNVLVDAVGGTPAYVGTGNFMTGPGTHVFTVYDANGCSESQSITIATSSTNPLSIDAVTLERNNDLKSEDAQATSSVQGSFNTSNQQIEITYELKYDSGVSIEVYDMSGALVESINEEKMALKGETNFVSIDSDKLTSGVYIYHFITNTERQVGKLQIVR